MRKDSSYWKTASIEAIVLMCFFFRKDISHTLLKKYFIKHTNNIINKNLVNISSYYLICSRVEAGWMYKNTIGWYTCGIIAALRCNYIDPDPWYTETKKLLRRVLFYNWCLSRLHIFPPPMFPITCNFCSPLSPMFYFLSVDRMYAVFTLSWMKYLCCRLLCHHAWV